MPKLTLEQDRARVKSLFDFDRKIAESCLGKPDAIILGIDEVGRGPVAGPLAAGGVVFTSEVFIQYLNDSKKITEKRRPIVAESIKKCSTFFDVEYASAAEIDEFGIVCALKKVFLAIIQKCEKSGYIPDLILIDGNKIDIDPRVTTIVKGDAQSASIAAASVIAKVARDSLMTDLGYEFPQYEWAKNKGYGTKAHTDAILEFGLTDQHRRTFLKKFI